MIAPPKPERRAPRPRKRIARTSRQAKRTVRIRQQRKTNVAGLKRRLWGLLALYVKERDGRTCISCPASNLDGGNRHAGHLISRRVSSTLFDPTNVHVQCGACNIWKRGNAAAYTLAFLDKYGEDKFRSLLARSRELHHWTAPQLRELIDAITKSGADYETLYEEKYGGWRS
jgi:5-methylcytosine-specific restriction endonuclease McrA